MSVFSTINVVSTLNSTDTATGSLTLAGGLGVAKKMFIGDVIDCSTPPTEGSHLTNKSYVDNQVHQVITWKQTVIEFRAMVSNPPLTPSVEDRYISTETGGVFTTNYIYEYDGSGWIETIVSEGDAVYVESDNKSYVFSDGGTWSNIGVSIDHNILLNLQAANTGVTYGHINDTTQSIYGVKTFANTTNASLTNNGSVVISGGLGLAKNLYVGGITNITSTTSNQLTLGYNGSNNVLFDVSSGGDLTIDASGNDINMASTDTVKILNTTVSTSSSTGSLIVSGGVAVGNNLSVGGFIKYPSNTGGIYYKAYDTLGTTDGFGGRCIESGVLTSLNINNQAFGGKTDYFSLKLIGYINPQYSETYTFTLTSDDYAKLYIDNRLVVPSNTSYTGTITLTANTWYSFYIETYETTGNAIVKVEWESSSLVKEVVPNTYLGYNQNEVSPSILGSTLFNGAITLKDEFLTENISSGNYTAHTTVNNGELQAISANPVTNAILLAPLRTTERALFNSNKKLTPNMVGSGIISGGYFDCNSVTNGSLIWDNNTSWTGYSGEVRIRYTPLAVVRSAIFGLGENGLLPNLIRFNQTGSSTYEILFNDSASNAVLNVGTIYTVVIGVEHEIIFNWDWVGDSCTFNFYIDGIRVYNPTVTGLTGRTLTPRIHSVVGGIRSYGTVYCKFRDFMVFNQVMTTGTSAGSFQIEGGMNLMGPDYLKCGKVVIRNPTDETKLNTLTTGTSGSLTLDSGNLIVASTTESTDTATGALQISGGAGISKNLNVGGITNITSTTANQLTLGYDSSNKVAFNVGLSGDLEIDSSGNELKFHSTETVKVLNTTEATDTLTGGLVVSGGCAVAKRLYVGGKMYATDTIGIYNGTGLTTFYTGANGDLEINCTGNDINMHSTDTVRILNTAQSSNTESGALIISGGLSTVKNAYIGGSAVITGASSIQNELSVYGTLSLYDASPANGAAALSVDASGNLTLESEVDVKVSATNPLKVLNTTEASDTASGSMIISGGVSVAKKLYVGGNIIQGAATLGANTNGLFVTSSDNSEQDTTIYDWSNNIGQFTVTDSNTARWLATTFDTTNGFWSIQGIHQWVNTIPICLNPAGASSVIIGSAVGGAPLIVAATTESTNTATGALQVAGGVSIAKNLNVGGDINSGSSVASQSFTGGATLTANLSLYRIGHQMFLYFPLTTGTTTSSTYFTGTGIIPSSFRPSANVRKVIFVTNNNTEVMGSVTITSTGNVIVYNGSSGNFDNGGVCGFGLDLTFFV